MATTKNVQWGKFTKSDWKPEGGKSRNFVNKKTGEVISRRQYDKHYGAIRAFGSYEEKAKHFKDIQGGAQLLKPARGRKSKIKALGEERERAIQDRRKLQQQIAADRKIQRASRRHPKPPQRITRRSFKPNHRTRAYELPINYDAVVSTINAGRRSGLVFGYLVGVNLIDMRDGSPRTYTYGTLRHINKAFTQGDYEKMLDEVSLFTYAVPVSLFVRFKLKESMYKGK